MASYNRLGSYLLGDVLAEVPFGRIHRAISITGSAFERHHLICTFTDELLQAGLAARGPEIQRTVGQLGPARGIGANCAFEARKEVYLTWDYIAGRTLAQVLEKTREEQVPFGVDHALTVLQSVAQAVIAMHDRNVRARRPVPAQRLGRLRGRHPDLRRPARRLPPGPAAQGPGPEGRPGALPLRRRGPRRSSATCSRWARCSSSCSPWSSSRAAPTIPAALGRGHPQGGPGGGGHPPGDPGPAAGACCWWTRRSPAPRSSAARWSGCSTKATTAPPPSTWPS